MKLILLAYLAIIIYPKGVSQPQKGADRLAGTWESVEMHHAHIQMYKAADGFWYGKISRSAKPEDVGKILFKKGVYHADKGTWTGLLVKPDNGMIIDAALSQEENGQLKIVGTKYFISKTFLWTKIE